MKTNILLIIVILAATTCAVNAATKVTARSGPFGYGSTWTDGIAPAPGDDIIILAGHGVGGTSGRVVGNLTVQGELELYNPGLTVNGNLRVESGAELSALSGILYFNGSECINDGTISASTHFDGTDLQTVSGSGTWTANGGQFNGGKKVLEDVQMSRGWWTVNSHVAITTRWLMKDGRINKSADGIIESPVSGYVEFQGTGTFASYETTGNLWTARVMVKGTRSAVNTSAISAPVNVENGGTLAASLNMTLHLKDLIIIRTGGKLNGQAIRLSGEYVVNHGEVHPTVLEFSSDGNQEISGEGAWKNSNGIYFRGSGTKSLATDMTATNTNIKVESPLNLNDYNLTLDTGAFSKSETGSIDGAGKIILAGKGNIYSHETTGNLWKAPILIASGTHSINSSSSFSAGVTIESGAVLSTHLNMTLHLKNSVSIKSGAQLSGAKVRLSGADIINHGEVFPTVLEFDSDEEQKIDSGSGVWRNSNGIYFLGRGRKSLLSDMTTRVGTVKVDGRLNLDNFNFNVYAGNFYKPETGTITGTGKVVSTGEGRIYSHETAGNLWYAPLEIASGTRSANSSSSFTGPITVKTGAMLSTHLRITIHAIGGLTVEPDASVTGETLQLYNGDFVNNGTATARTYFNGTNTLSGTTGSFVNTAYFKPGAAVRLDGVQQFKNLTVYDSGAFDITNQTIKVAGVLSVAGTLATKDSTIEFNSASAEQSVPTNIDYYNLTINNPREVNLGAAETVESILRLEKGVFDIATNRLTILSCMQIVYGSGTLKGTPVNLNCS